jgi:hypothetical protein
MWGTKWLIMLQMALRSKALEVKPMLIMVTNLRSIPIIGSRYWCKINAGIKKILISGAPAIPLWPAKPKIRRHLLHLEKFFEELL